MYKLAYNSNLTAMGFYKVGYHENIPKSSIYIDLNLWEYLKKIGNFKIKESVVLEDKLYTLDDAFIFEKIYNEVIPPENGMSLEDKVKEIEMVHTDMILDIDFRVMDIEDNLGLTPINIINKLRNGEENMNSTYIMLKNKIESKYYEVEEMKGMLDRYLARKRISVDEYDFLMDMIEKDKAEKVEGTI